MKQYIFDQFVENILKHTGFTKEQLFANNRKRDGSDARKFLYKLCKDRGLSTKAIETYMEENGYVCYSNTVPQALSTFEKEIANDPDYTVILQKLSIVDA
jgi:hypothetical protein|tara:strand:+ start:16868 stop:17167 length:300 start_codon:yes stop_codon:yes gene_type:complete